MLEQLQFIAIQYTNQTEDDSRLIAFGLLVLGGVLAGFVSRSKGELRRSPYFVYSSLLLLAAVATQFVWLEALPAMIGGYLWVLMITDVVSRISIGYFLGLIAMARSRDAFGHGRFATFAFIPFVNLVLLLKASRNEVSANRIPTIPLITGGLGVLSGFVMLIAAVALNSTLDTQIEQAQNDPTSQSASIRFMIESQGLEDTLKQMAAGVIVPQRVDADTTLLLIESDATTLRYFYEVKNDIPLMTDAFHTGLIQNVCTNGPIRPVLEAGGAIEHAYHRTNGDEISRVRITQERCGF